MALALLLSAPALGGTPPPPDGISLDGVPEGAAWVIDGRARQLAALPAFQRLSREGRGGDRFRRLQALARQAGVDMTNDVQRIQVISLGATGTVAIVDGDWNRARLLRTIQAQPGLRTLAMKGLELFCFDGPRAGDTCVLHVSGPRRLLAGTTTAGVAAVADALARPGVAEGVSRTFGEMTRASPGALLVLGARDGAALMKLVPDGALLMEAQAITAQMGRLPENRLGVSLVGQGADEATTANLAALLNAMQAMLAFRAASDPQWTTLAQTMRIQTEGKRVRAGFEVDKELTCSLLTTLMSELSRKGQW
ncbi:MAG: hypothetical protein GX571_05100 [Lentisphaerae bacterium]|nr:hypothetical protein [Lentisphaerota bacterium]